MNAYRSFITLMLMLALASVAQAATLYTPPLQSGSLACTMVNVSNQARVVEVTVMRGNGSVLDTTGPLSLPPLTIAGMALGGPSDYHFCKFQVEGGKDAVRGSLCIIDDSSGNCITAVEAQ